MAWRAPLLSTLALGSGCFSTTTGLRGVVTLADGCDDDAMSGGAAIAGATVTIACPESEPRRARSDIGGRFFFDLADSQLVSGCTVEVLKPGYHTQRVPALGLCTAAGADSCRAASLYAELTPTAPQASSRATRPP
jgi:hypothetical protein